MTPEALHELAVNCGATVLGDPPHYLMTAEQLAAIAERLTQEPQKAIIPPPPC